MKNEDFDKVIREKLDGFESPFTDSDVDKVHHAVGRKGWFTGSAGGKLLLLSVSTVAFVALVYLALNLTSSHNSAPQNPSAQKTETSNPQNPVSSISNPENSTSQKNENNESQAVAGNSEPNKILKQESKPNKETRQKAVVDVKGQSAKHITPASTEKIIPPTPENVARNNETIIEEPVEVDDKNLSSESNLVQNEKIAEQGEILPETKLSMDSAKVTTLVKMPDEQALADKTHEKTSIMSESSETENKETSKGFFSSFLEGLLVNVGAGFRASNQSYGPGISVDFWGYKNFGLGIGLDYLFYYAEKYDNIDDMIRDGKPHPDDDFNHHKNPRDRITDVELKNWLMQMPVSVHYKFPLRRSYSLALSAGVDIDLWLYKKLNYIETPDSMPPQRRDFNTKADVNYFNTMYVAAGLQKFGNSWIVKMQPFVSFRLKQVYYKPSQLEYGIQLNFQYRLKKNKKPAIN